MYSVYTPFRPDKEIQTLLCFETVKTQETQVLQASRQLVGSCGKVALTCQLGHSVKVTGIMLIGC
jgi:hypothetical protein